MSTYTKILYQVVFGSTGCKPFLTEKNQEELFRYIAGILHAKKCFTYIVGGYSNHVHLVFSLHPLQSLSGIIGDIKKATSYRLLKDKNKFLRFPGWQTGYGAFTYAYDSMKQLVNYVENQKDHHRRISFMEELIGFLKEHGIDYNEKYLFV